MVNDPGWHQRHVIVACKVMIVHVRIVKKKISEPAVIVFPSQCFGKAWQTFVYEDSACSLNVTRGIKGKWKEKNRKRKTDGEWDHESNQCWMRDESNLNITSQRPKPLLERLKFSMTKEFLPVEGRLAKLNISYTDTRINSTNEQLYFTRNFRLQTCTYKFFNFTFQTLTAQ